MEIDLKNCCCDIKPMPKKMIKEHLAHEKWVKDNPKEFLKLQAHANKAYSDLDKIRQNTGPYYMPYDLEN